MSHFYIVKNLWKPHRKPANLPHFRLPAPIGQKFNRISIDFLQSKNGSKNFYDRLRPIPTYTEGPQIFKKIVIALICIWVRALDFLWGLEMFTIQHNYIYYVLFLFSFLLYSLLLGHKRNTSRLAGSSRFRPNATRWKRTTLYLN